MKTKLKIKGLLILLHLSFFLNVQAQVKFDIVIDTNIAAKPKEITVKLEANYMRHYLWRGALFGSDDVSQPTIDIGYKNFGVILGANLNYIPKNLPKESYQKNVVFDEQDVEIYYNNKIKKFAYEVKIDGYFYFNQINSPSTLETAVKFDYPLIKNISAYTENVLDIRSYKGSLYNYSGVKWEYSKKQNDFAIQTGVSFCNEKFSNAYYGTSVNGVLFVGGKAAFTHHFKNFYGSIAGEYYKYTNENIVEAAERSYTTNLIISVGKELQILTKGRRRK